MTAPERRTYTRSLLQTAGDDAKRRLARAVLKRHRGNISAAARELLMREQTLRPILYRLGLLQRDGEA